MPILKQTKSRRMVHDAVVLDLGDLDRQGRRILEEAQEKAAAVLETAEHEAGRLTSEAAEIGHKQGLEQGLKEGLVEGRERARQEVMSELKPRLDCLVETWSAAVTQWEKDRADMLLAARQDVLRFAIEMGRKVIFRAIENDPSIVNDQVAAALSLLSQRTKVVIAVHPDDRLLLEEALPDVVVKCSQCEDATIREDAALTRGGCIVRTANGEIDASIETQIERIVEALLPRAAEDRSEAS